MSTIHLTLMGKGGVGKSFVTTLLAQYLMNKDGAKLFCADTDPTNPTFSSYPGISAKHINIMTPKMNIDKEKFDELIEMMLEHDGDCVVDNGASSFLPIMAYMMEKRVIEFFIESGKKVYIHAPLVGGLGLDETLRGLSAIMKHVPAQIIVWENEIFGPVEKDGKAFTGSDVYQQNADRFKGVIKLEQRSEDTFGKTLHTLTSNRLTFKEAHNSPLFMTMARQRLVIVEKDVKEQLDKIAL